MECVQESGLEALLESRKPNWSLPQPFYTSPEIHDADMEVFRHNWLFAGFECRLKKPGDWLTFELGSDSLIIIRGDDGEVRALHNVCRHRGSRICLNSAGHSNKIVCPYHQWVYDARGALCSAHDMADGFDRSAFGLKQARVRVVTGLVFVALSEDAPDFEPFARNVAAFAAPHELHRARVACEKVYRVKANWKLVVENSRECYHCPAGHPGYTRVMLGAEPEDGRQRVAGYEACGLRTKRVVGPWYSMSRYPTARREFVTQSLDGKPVAPPMGRFTTHDNGVMGFSTFPNLMTGSPSDYSAMYRFTPLHATETLAEVFWLVREDAVEGRDYDLEKLTAFWKDVSEEDWKLCEDNQAGVNSPAYEPGPYASGESDTERFVLWYLGEIKSRLAEHRR